MYIPTLDRREKKAVLTRKRRKKNEERERKEKESFQHPREINTIPISQTRKIKKNKGERGRPYFYKLLFNFIVRGSIGSNCRLSL